MKKYRIKNYKGNLIESVSKFQKTHSKMRIVEAFEDEMGLAIAAEPNTTNPYDTVDQQETVPADQQDPIDRISAFGAKLLMFGVEVHLWHLNCRKYAQHLALQELYEACDDIGDKLVEAVIGINAKPVACPVADMTCDFTEHSIDKILAMKGEAASLAGCGYAGIDNVLDDFCEICNSVVYKLKQLD